MASRAERPADLGSIEAVTRAAFRDGLGHIPGRPAGRAVAGPHSGPYDDAPAGSAGLAVGAVAGIMIGVFRGHPFSRRTEHRSVLALRAAGALTLSKAVHIRCGHFCG